jgi:myo-inositol-1(or 4)-monophosphatase
VAGGICNPAADVTVLGAVESGVSLNGAPCAVRRRAQLRGAEVLASRSETGRGEWEHTRQAPFVVRPLGSVAYKLARVAAGLTDATWTLVPKHEWDVAAGAALVVAAGGSVWIPGGAEPRFNRERPLLPGLVACATGLEPPIRLGRAPA